MSMMSELDHLIREYHHCRTTVANVRKSNTSTEAHLENVTRTLHAADTLVTALEESIGAPPSHELPEDYLVRSKKLALTTGAQAATAAALQGILLLLLQQDADKMEMDDGDGEPPANPFGECAKGHMVFSTDCPDCVADLAADDTVPSSDRDK